MANPTLIVRPAFPGGRSWLGLSFRSTRSTLRNGAWHRDVSTSWMDRRADAIESACESIPEPKHASNP